MDVIRILEDPAIPWSVANRVFRLASKDPASVLIVAWSPYRWKNAATEWESRTGKPRPGRLQIKETDRERWNTGDREAFPCTLGAWLDRHPVELLVVADDFVILPSGMPGGHIFAGHSGYCPICKLWLNDTSKGC